MSYRPIAALRARSFALAVSLGLISFTGAAPPDFIDRKSVV